MKQILVLLLFLGTTHASHALWTVYDPTLHKQEILSSAKEVAKFVEMIENQVKQLRVLEEEVATFHHYVDLFGDPAAVVVAASEPLRADLEKKEPGAVLEDLLEAVNPKAAMDYIGHGLFPSIGGQYKTPGGLVLKRQDILYRSIAALQGASENFVTVATDVTSRRATLKHQLSQTIEALEHATTDAEVQKLGVILTGLGTALQGTESELAQASASTLVQDIATRNDQARQMEARKEQQAAEFTETMENYGKTFHLMSASTAFPTD